MGKWGQISFSKYYLFYLLQFWYYYDVVRHYSSTFRVHDIHAWYMNVWLWWHADHKQKLLLAWFVRTTTAYSICHIQNLLKRPKVENPSGAIPSWFPPEAWPDCCDLLSTLCELNSLSNPGILGTKNFDAEKVFSGTGSPSNVMVRDGVVMPDFFETSEDFFCTT